MTRERSHDFCQTRLLTRRVPDWPFLYYRRIMRLDDFGQGILVRRFVRHLIGLV